MTLTKETGATPPPSHALMVPVVEDMFCLGRAGLTKAVVTDPSRAILFCRRWSLGEGLSLGEVRDTKFTLTGVGTWVGKSAYLAADPLTIQEGWWAIAQAITECQIEVRGPGWPCSQPLTPQSFQVPPFWGFSHKEQSGNASFVHQPSPHRPQRGWDHDWHWGGSEADTTPATLTFTGSWIWKPYEFSVNSLIGIITVRQVRRLPALLM